QIEDQFHRTELERRTFEVGLHRSPSQLQVSQRSFQHHCAAFGRNLEDTFSVIGAIRELPADLPPLYDEKLVAVVVGIVPRDVEKRYSGRNRERSAECLR